MRQTDVEIGEMERRRQVAQNGNVQVKQVSSLRASPRSCYLLESVLERPAPCMVVHVSVVARCRTSTLGRTSWAWQRRRGEAGQATVQRSSWVTASQVWPVVLHA